MCSARSYRAATVTRRVSSVIELKATATTGKPPARSLMDIRRRGVFLMAQAIQMERPEAAGEFVDIPGTTLLVSRVALGTWAMGGWMWGGTDERESVATIRAALDQGINLIDTAPAYGFGVSEEIVGRAVPPAGLRSRAVKIG